MRFFLSFLIVSLSFSCFSQSSVTQPLLDFKLILTDVNGAPIMAQNNLGVQGSVYLFDEYKPGRVTVNKRVYKDVKLKLDLEKNAVYFEKGGVEMVTTDNVDRLDFFDTNLEKYTHVFRNGFAAVGRNTDKTYYQILDSGKVSLLKQINIIYRESTAYGAPSATRSYEQIKSYYLLVNNTLTPIKSSEAFLLAMPDKKNEVSSFLSSKRIKFNREDDLKRLTIYYNNL